MLGAMNTIVSKNPLYSLVWGQTLNYYTNKCEIVTLISAMRLNAYSYESI